MSPYSRRLEKLESISFPRGTHLDFRHGDGDVLGLDGELHALPGVGGEALGLAGALAAVLPRTTVERRRRKRRG